MKKLAVIDLMFNWPPDGGARIDLKETLVRLAPYFDVVVLVPRIDCIVSRGLVIGELPFQVEPIPFTEKEFNGHTIVTRFRAALDRINPSVVFLADGFYLKPWVAQAIRDYPYFVKFYAYETFCLRYNGTFMRGDRSCYRTGMGHCWIDSLFCSMCGFNAAIKAFLDDSPGFLREFLGASAWSPLHWRRTRTMMDGAQEIIVNNHFFQELIGRCGWTSVVIPPGIDTAQYPVTPCRHEMNPVRLGLVGRINDSYKGVVFAIRALRILHARGIDAELHVTGIPDDSPLALPGVVFRGWFTRDTINEFYRSIDICLVPSIWQEPFGIVTLEAMCSGRPVVGSRVAGIQEVVIENETGLLVSPQSSEDIADAVQRYLENPDFTAEIVKNAARHVRALYDWDLIVRDYYLPVIHRILDQKGQKSGSN
ncbi:glycosyltransferase family 4 protein [bacterium]|nr:glycosyltransferase family 4 protein [candidate division CSSED10-310 bacterium]